MTLLTLFAPTPAPTPTPTPTPTPAYIIEVPRSRVIVPYTVVDAALTSSIPVDEYVDRDKVVQVAPLYNAVTSYSVGDVVYRATTNHAYESLIGANAGNTPEDSPDEWLDLGPTNRWAMFDLVNGTQTVAEDEIEVTVSPSGRADSVALFNIAGSSVTITAQVGSTELYNATFSLIDTSGVTDYYTYVFVGHGRKNKLVVTDLPLNSGISITITVTGSTVRVGTCVVGQQIGLGDAKYSPKIGIRDFSRKEDDAFGNYIVVERPFRELIEVDVSVRGQTMEEAASKVDALAQLLAQYRATPLVWIFSDLYDSTKVFGFFKSISLDIAFPTISNLSLSIEGLSS